MAFNPETWMCLYCHLGTAAATTESANHQLFRYRYKKEVSEQDDFMTRCVSAQVLSTNHHSRDYCLAGELYTFVFIELA